MSITSIEQSTIPASSSRRLKAAWVFWALIAALGILVYIAYLPSSLQEAHNDLPVLKSYLGFDHLMSFPAFVAGVIWIRSLAVVIFLLAAFICIVHVASARGEYAFLSLHTALMLILLPQAIILGAMGADLPYARPWDLLLESASIILGMSGLLLWLLFYYTFPDGKVVPRRVHWIFILLLAGLSLFTIVTATGLLSAEWAWGAMMLTILATLLAGVILQLYRYRHAPDPSFRKQVHWVVVALALQPLLIFTLPFDSIESLSALVLFLQVLLPTLIPIALIVSILHNGLWGAQVKIGYQRAYGWAIGLLAFACLGFALGFGHPQDPQAYARMESPPVQPSGEPLPVIVDTDMAPDDWMAILYLLQRPDVEVLAITVTGTGEAHCEPGVRHAAGLVALAGESVIPVACGPETPLPGGHSFPDSWRGAVDGLLGLDLPDGGQLGATQGGVELLLETVRSSPEDVTVVALGPLTNLALAIEQDASFLLRLSQVYIMGGALQVPGNVGFSAQEIDNLDAEWNIYADPLAARIVVESGAPVTLVPLDATNHVPADLRSYRMLQSNRRTAEAEFVYQVLNKRMDAILSGFISYWDPLAAAIAVEESLGNIKEGKVLVITDEGPHSGATRLVASGTPVRYAKSADAERFLQEFVGALNQE